MPSFPPYGGHVDLDAPETMQLASAIILVGGELKEIELSERPPMPMALTQFRDKPRWMASSSHRYGDYEITVDAMYRSDIPELTVMAEVRLPQPQSLEEEERMAVLDAQDIKVRSVQFRRTT